MDTFEVIHGRRSIRRYTGQAVPADVLEALVRAAMSAPSAGGEQPWHFVVLTQRRILNAIAEYHEYAAMLRAAPAAIAVCGDTGLEVYKGFWVQDCAAATQNLLLAAHAKGLGAVWLGVYPIEARVVNTQRLLGLPETVIPLAVVALGYPAERKEPADRYDALRVHWDRW